MDLKDYQGRKGRHINPHHKSYHPDSLYDAWIDFSLWVKEIFLWITGLKVDPSVLTKFEEEVFSDFQKAIPKEIKLDQPYCRWINHSSFLIHYEGVTFLTDPIWSLRATPVDGFGPKRKHPTPFPLWALEPIDYVLISHDHFDHLDLPTLKKLHKLQPDIEYLVPTGCRYLLESLGIKKIKEFKWWESTLITHNGFDLRFTAVPAQHFSGRGVADVNSTLWLGWVVDAFKNKFRDRAFYFVGDTGYNPIDFREIGKRFGPIDLSLIPIGAYLPRKIMSTIHVNPYEAVLIHKDVQSLLSIACHYHTFELAQEPMFQPPCDLMDALKSHKVPLRDFLLSDPGQYVNW